MLAGADHLIAGLPRQWETVLGPTFEGGTDFSLGQWQKLAIARGFLREADVVVLDEPTASLDPQAEAEVMERFASLMAGKTAILVSHRLGWCRSVDRVVVLRDGTVVEDGAHETLLAQQGEYARLFGEQAKWYVSARPEGEVT